MAFEPVGIDPFELGAVTELGATCLREGAFGSYQEFCNKLVGGNEAHDSFAASNAEHGAFMCRLRNDNYVKDTFLPHSASTSALETNRTRDELVWVTCP